MNIILLTRHFPPHVSGGARRPYGLAIALQKLGTKVQVIAPALPQDVSGITVYHANANPNTEKANARITPLRDLARELILLPDPDVRWARRAAKAVIVSNIPKPDWIITTSPPESIHVAGAILKKHFNCRWLGDFRDLWLQSPLRQYRNNRLRRFRENRIAKQLLSQMDGFVAVDGHIQHEISGYAPPRMPNAVIPNFPLSYDLLPQGQSPVLTAKFRNIVYTGSFSLSDPKRQIEPALTEYASSAKASDCLHIAGRLTLDEVKTIEKFSNSINIKYHGVLNLTDAIAMQKAADILMLYAAPHALAPSGKFHEYRALAKPILVIGDGPWREVVAAADCSSRVITSLTEPVPDVKAPPEYPVENQLGFAKDFLALMRRCELDG